MRDHVDSVRSGEPEITVAPEFPSLQRDFYFTSFYKKHFLNKSLSCILSFAALVVLVLSSIQSRELEFRAEMDAYIGVVSIVSCQELIVA